MKRKKKQVATNIAVIAIIDAYYEGWYNNNSNFDYTKWSLLYVIRDCLSAGSFDGVDFDEKLTPYADAAAAYAAAYVAAYAADVAYADAAYAAAAAAYAAADDAADAYAVYAAADAAAAAYALKAAEGNLSTVWPTIFGGKTEELTFNSSISNLSEHQTSDKFTIDTSEKATLTYENDIITFNIPLDFPEYISIDGSVIPIESFAVKSAKIHPMLSN